MLVPLFVLAVSVIQFRRRNGLLLDKAISFDYIDVVAPEAFVGSLLMMTVFSIVTAGQGA